MIESLFKQDVLADLKKKGPAARTIVDNIEKFQSLAEIDPEMAVVRARKALEYIVLDINKLCNVTYEVALKHLFGKKDGYRLSLNDSIVVLEQMSILNAKIANHFYTIRKHGNSGAHILREWGEIEDSIDRDILTVVAISLNAVVQWYAKEMIPKKREQLKWTIVSGRQVTEKMIRSALEMDDMVFESEFRGQFEVSKRWHARNPEVFTLAVDTELDKVIGCITAMPLEDDVFEQLKSGTLLDMDMPDAAIRRFELPDYYKLYICAVVVHPEYRGTDVLMSLIQAYIDKLIGLAKKDIFISEIISDAITPEGERLSRYLGMKPIGQSTHGSSVYTATLLPPTIRTNVKALHEKLMPYYESKVEEYRQFMGLNKNEDNPPR